MYTSFCPIAGFFVFYTNKTAENEKSSAFQKIICKITLRVPIFLLKLKFARFGCFYVLNY